MKIQFLIPVFVLILLSCSKEKIQTDSLRKISYDNIKSGKVPDVGIIHGKNFTIEGNRFVDSSGREMFIRGINLGGSSKIPYKPCIATHVSNNFFNGSEVSFTGRPFPLEEADEHFSRLKAWGFHFIRLLVTWEAIEHKGPGIYDEEYLDYIRKIIKKAESYGINVMIDPHQDVWSRFSGGDGAPLWTFQVAGLNVKKFQETGAAFIHNVYGDPFPKMIWYTNYFKLAAATMFTLFYGGDDFAPHLKADSVGIQEFLQAHYIMSFMKVAEKVKDLPNVIGFELMNEPSSGYIGIKDITAKWNYDIVGDNPTAYEGMVLGAGVPYEVGHFEVGIAGLREAGKKLLNEKAENIWNDSTGIWQKEGVWRLLDDGSPKMLVKNYFSEVNGRKVDFNKDYYEPFAVRYADSIRSVCPEWFICVGNALFPSVQELPELKEHPDIKWVNGSHWYDDVTLFKKKYIPWVGYLDGEIILGKNRVKNAFVKYLADMINETREKYGDAPSLLGEFGIPFDMNEKESFRTGDFSDQIKALDRSFDVVEANLFNYTLWNYTADNTNKRGDNWNGEDLSIFSLSQQKDKSDINSGGRALEAAVRPYPVKIPGKLLKYDYRYRDKELLIELNFDRNKQPVEIFVPEFDYPRGFDVYVTGGNVQFDEQARVLLWFPDTTGKNTMVVKPFNKL
ncbi:MAG: cellulase family glycosylhydrolase [Chlorobi bacterium]|nr:cellulase family glycosylhydrolase [Chlorobiota bacterium]